MSAAAEEWDKCGCCVVLLQHPVDVHAAMLSSSVLSGGRNCMHITCSFEEHYDEWQVIHQCIREVSERRIVGTLQPFMLDIS